jgi:hypothetical protein
LQGIVIKENIAKLLDERRKDKYIIRRVSKSICI